MRGGWGPSSDVILAVKEIAVLQLWREYLVLLGNGREVVLEWCHGVDAIAGLCRRASSKHRVLEFLCWVATMSRQGKETIDRSSSRGGSGSRGRGIQARRQEVMFCWCPK